MSIHRTRLSVADTITHLNNAGKKLPSEEMAAEQQLSLPIWQKIVRLRLVWAAISAVISGGLLFGYLQLSDKQPDPILKLALADLRIGSYKSAQQLFDTLPEKISEDSTVQFHQGMAHHIEYIASLTAPELTQHPERALDMYAILHIPPNTRTIENRPKEPLQRASQHYRNGLKADEHNIDAWVALMLSYLRIGDLSEAQATMTRIESIPKIQKESAVYLNAQGILQLRGANPNQAISLFEKAIQVAEDQEQPFLDPYYNLALSYSLLDDPQGQQKAKVAWENYLLRDKNNDYWALQAWEQYEQVCAKLQTEPRDDLAEFVEVVNNIQ
ncbi:hypothetical protein IH992_18330, partial [Candidatus Poribacteria bacterium]|nr:hypothetical protein [Candidatus Poribacteria bacterium]